MYKYDYIDEVSKGAFSICNLYNKNDSKFAIKIPKDSNFCNSYNELKEIAALKILCHENIINIEEIIINKNNKLNLVYKFYVNELKDFIKDNDEKTRDNLAIQLIQQLFSAVHHMHSLNIIHTDLKDSNILVDNSNGFKIKIIDFGSCYIENLIPKSKLVSTYTVRAPEVYNYDYNYSNKIDIWSIGVLIYSFLTGNDLLDTFVHKDTSDINKLDDIYLFISKFEKLKIEGKYKSILRHMLDIDQNTRYDINEMIILFQSIFNEEISIDRYDIKYLRIENYLDHKQNDDILKFNNYLKAKNLDVVNSNLYIGSNILSLIKKYCKLDILSAWYLDYLITSKDTIENLSKFITLFNTYFFCNFNYIECEINCLKLLKKINFKLI